MSTNLAFDGNPVFWADPSGADSEEEGIRLQDGRGNWHTISSHAGYVIYEAPEEDNEDSDKKPDDIIFVNNDGDEIGRIILPGEDYEVTVDTNSKPLTPFEIEPEPDADAVGFNGEASVTVGGGMHYGVGFVYFLDGINKGELFSYEFLGANVGIGSGVGFSPFTSYFNEDEAPSSFFGVGGYEGKYNGYSASFFIEGSYSWSNVENTSDELYPGHRYTTTWKTIGASTSAGAQVDARYFGGETYNFSQIYFD
jgi:hypothetical protein